MDRMVDPLEGEFAERDWHARWIWAGVPAGPDPSNLFQPDRVPRPRSDVLFRRCFELSRVPTRAPARFTADSRHLLSVNGCEVARGPVRSNPRRLRYDTADLAPFLRPGRNAIAVHVRYYGRPNAFWMPAPRGLQLGAGAFLFEARVGRDSEPEEWLVSDDAWRALHLESPAIRMAGVSTIAPEIVDGLTVPLDWRELDFDDEAWDTATVLRPNSIGWSNGESPPHHPYGPLLARPIPQLGGQRRTAQLRTVAVGEPDDGVDLEADPVAQVRAAVRASAVGEEGTRRFEAKPGDLHVLTFDFGQVVSGTLELDVDAPAGTCFDLAGSELLDASGQPDLAHQQTGLRYVARGEADRFESFDPIGLRYAQVAVRGAGAVDVRSVAVHERLYPRPPGPFFECSDATLNRIWAIGRRTVDLNSHDAYLDCPTREQRAWTGDFVVHQMVDLATNPDWGLARWSVELAASPRPDGMLPMSVGGDVECVDSVFIPDWALHWIRALHNLYRYTGERDRIARLLPAAEGVLRWFTPFLRTDGLLADVTGWVIIDWSSVTVAGRSSALNALFARALRDFAEMAAWLGDGGRAGWARGVLNGVAQGFERFWDPERGVYADHILAGERGRPLSQHAQAAALAAGLVPEDRVESVVDALVDRSRHVHANWSAPEGDVRHAGVSVGGPYLMLGTTEPWWDVDKQLVVAQPFFRYVVHDALARVGQAERIPDLCLDWQALFARSETSWSETWYGGTVSHGWCSTPTRDLIVRTLGIEPSQPGFSVARVAPRLGFLEWARGAAPTPRGLLSVDVRLDRIEIDSPVPFDLDLGAADVRRYPAGRHRVSRVG